MTNQERFHWFDVYLESIEGLSPSIKKPISQLARCVFEAETGIDVSNAPVDVADILGIQNVIDTISDSIDNKKPLPKDIVQQINDLTYAIDKLQDSNDLKNLDTSAAKAAINTFANTKPMIDSLNRELADLKRQYSGLNRNMDPQKLQELSEQVATINNTKRMLDAIGKPYDQLKSHLDMLDQAINNAKHDERNLNYRQHEFDRVDVLGFGLSAETVFEKVWTRNQPLPVVCTVPAPASAVFVQVTPERGSPVMDGLVVAL